MKNNRHNYEYEVDTSSESAPANVIRMVGENKHALEIGCGPGSITRVLSQQRHCRMTAIELDPDAIEKVRPYCINIMRADLNDAHWPSLLDGMEKFDVVIAADVLEHLYDPWAALKRMRPLIKRDGYIVISLPHVGHAAVMACLLNGDFDYRDWGLLDRTHIRFFGLKNMEHLFAQAGLKIVETRYVMKSPEETEFSAVWSKLSSRQKEVLMGSPHSEIYQVVIRAIAADTDKDLGHLMPPAHRHSAAARSIPLKRRISPYLPRPVKNAIRRGLSLMGVKS
jgi:2-polyprenyl-3-methyl-5-hydroxy-6-metoxy-1,4-benzoquinol methylase